MLLLPPELIALLCVVYGIPEWLKIRYPWYIQAFNIANHTLNGLAAWGAVELVRNAGLGPELEFALSGLVASVVFVSLNHMLLATMLHLARGHSFRGTGLFSVESLSTDFVLAMLGVALAGLWDWNPLLLPMAVAPLLLIHRSLSVPALQQEARVDPKTGLFNARYFAAALREELDRAQRSGTPLSVIMADLDLLREINNAYGHLAGDAVLHGIAGVFQRQLRHSDIPARFGGEEFAIVLPETTPQEAFEIAERIRRAVAEERFEVETSSEPIRATVSFGVAGCPADGTDANELVHQADLAVYRAKLQGRNRVLRASSEPVLLPPDRTLRLAAVPDETVYSKAPAASAAVAIPELPPATAGELRREQQQRPHTQAGPRFVSLSRSLAFLVVAVSVGGIAAGALGFVVGRPDRHRRAPGRDRPRRRRPGARPRARRRAPSRSARSARSPGRRSQGRRPRSRSPSPPPRWSGARGARRSTSSSSTSARSRSRALPRRSSSASAARTASRCSSPPPQASSPAGCTSSSTRAS